MNQNLADPTDFVAYVIPSYIEDVHLFARVVERAIEDTPEYSWTYNKFMNTEHGTLRVMLIGKTATIRNVDDLIRAYGMYDFPDLTRERGEMVALNLHLKIPLYTLHDHTNYGATYAFLLSKCQ